MSGIDIGNWAMAIITSAVWLCVFILKAFFTYLVPLAGIFITMYLCYTMIRVFVIRLIGGSISSASDSVRYPKID